MKKTVLFLTLIILNFSPIVAQSLDAIKFDLGKGFSSVSTENSSYKDNYNLISINYKKMILGDFSTDFSLGVKNYNTHNSFFSSISEGINIKKFYLGLIQDIRQESFYKEYIYYGKTSSNKLMFGLGGEAIFVLTGEDNNQLDINTSFKLLKGYDTSGSIFTVGANTRQFFGGIFFREGIKIESTTLELDTTQSKIDFQFNLGVIYPF